MKFFSEIHALVVHKVGKFENGLLETDDPKHIEILKRVPEVQAEQVEDAPEDALEDAPDLSWKKDDLIAYAKEQGIEHKENATKKEILAAINEAI